MHSVLRPSAEMTDLDSEYWMLTLLVLGAVRWLGGGKCSCIDSRHLRIVNNNCQFNVIGGIILIFMLHLKSRSFNKQH
jgi:hypothetical protein